MGVSIFRLTKGLILFCFIALKSYSQSGLKFIENKNQWPSQIDFAARIPSGHLLVQPGSFQFAFLDEKKLVDAHHRSHSNETAEDDPFIAAHYLRTSFVNAHASARPMPFGKLPEYYNFFLGNDSTQWAGRVSAFEGTLYTNLYEGISLKVYSLDKNLKYDWVVSPGADASQIQINYAGADQVNIESGNLHVKFSLGEMIEMKPVAFQWIGDKKVSVACEYQLEGNSLTYCFPQGYDPCYELTIDPLLIFSTYSGSTADNWGSTATPGENGTLYSSGVTIPRRFSDFFPATAGAFQVVNRGQYDISILKYDSLGTRLLYATYLGGSQSESSHSLVMNSAQELLVLGTTSSTDFPTTASAFDKTFNGGVIESNVINYTNGSDVFVARLSKNGDQLLAGSYFGGSENDGMNPRFASPLVKNYGDELRGDIITDQSGNVYVSTVTSSPNFPVKNSFGLTYQGGVTDALVMKLDANLSQVIWAGFLGGSGADASHTIKIDRAGNLYVGGGTASFNFPTTSGSYQTSFSGVVDGFITKIKDDGTTLLNSTLTGTPQFNQVYFIDLDANEKVFAYGQTQGAFPITAGKYNNPNSGQFLQRFDNSLTTLEFSTVFGAGLGIPNISPTAFLVSDCDNIYMSGWGGDINRRLGFWPSGTEDMPVTPDAIQTKTSGNDFYFIVLSADASQLIYATYLGGNLSPTHVDGGTSRFGKGGVVYHAVCAGCAAFTGQPHSDFPTTTGAWSRLNRSSNCNNAAFKLDLSVLRASIQTNTVNLKQPGVSLVCMPDPIVFQNKSRGGKIFIWQLGDGKTQVKRDSSAITYRYAKTGTYRVKLIAIDEGSCARIDSAFATIRVVVAQGAAGPDSQICFGATAQLTASDGVAYQWKNSDGSFTSSQQNPNVKPTKTDSYFVTITDAQGCTKKDTLNVKVVPSIDLKFTVSRINFNCFNMPSLQVTSQTDPKEEIFYDFGDGQTSDVPTVVHQYQKPGVYTVRMVGKKEFCVYEKLELVQIDSLRVPNVITPALLDGQNDTFQVEYGDAQSRQSVKVSVLIYNRWGSLVYQSKDYKNDWSGSDVAAGVYYYETMIEGVAGCRGWVQVMK